MIRPQGGEFADFRGYAGVLAGGDARRRRRRHACSRPACAPRSRRCTAPASRSTPASPATPLVVELADKVDVARGDVLVAVDGAASRRSSARSVEADVCWMIDQPLTVGTRYWFKHGSRTGRADGHLDRASPRPRPRSTASRPTSWSSTTSAGSASQLSEPIVADRYVDNPDGGRLILIDEATNTTAGAAMVAAVRHNCLPCKHRLRPTPE